MTKDTIRLVSPWLESFDYESASRQIACEPGVVVVQMMPTPATWGGIQVCATTDSHIGCDIAQVLASDPRTGYKPGDYVVTNWDEGKKIAGFQAGSYRAKTNVVILGRSATSHGSVQTSITQSIFGTVNVKQYQLYLVPSGEFIPKCKTISADTYESYFRALEACSFKVQSYDGDFYSDIQIPEAGAYRMRVETNGIAKSLNVILELVGNVSRETLPVVERELPIKAGGRNLIVELDDLRDRSEGGILFLHEDHSRSSVATVLSVGPDVGLNRTGQYRQDIVQPGDRVIVMATGLRDIHIPGMNVKSIKRCDENSILCRVEESEQSAA
jgi:co-chaperonin GroES (HSP10)